MRPYSQWQCQVATILLPFGFSLLFLKTIFAAYIPIAKARGITPLFDNHDYLTGVMGSFNRTLSTIKKFLSAGIAVKVNSVITALNVDEMPNMVDMFRLCDIPIEKLTLTHYMNHGNAYYHDELKFNIDEHSETVVEAIDMAEKMDYAVSFRDFPLCLDSRLIKYREDLENMYILDLCDIDGLLSSEKAPAVVKKKCRKCLLFDKCPKYLAANYQEVSI